MSGHSSDRSCVIIGASHGGVNLAFALRREGWIGRIMLYDCDPKLPYHRPPLSKSFLTSDEGFEKYALKPMDSYKQEKIELNLGQKVVEINKALKHIVIEEGDSANYDVLVLATGASPIIPPIEGLNMGCKYFTMRTAEDAMNIQREVKKYPRSRVVVIGGGYIGLETAASLKKLGVSVTVLEREKRILGRVTAPYMSTFFMNLHADNGVEILTTKNVIKITSDSKSSVVHCDDGSEFSADIVIIGVGIKVNTSLAETANIEINNGICVDSSCRTSQQDIYAIGDCTFHFNPYYDRNIRLESVQNAVDQAKTAAANICGKKVNYEAIPWFWSDQYDVKLQMVGLSDGYNESLIRIEDGEPKKLSIWYFDEDKLLAVDAINNAKAYVLGTKFIKANEKVDKMKLADSSIPLSPANLLSN